MGRNIEALAASVEDVLGGDDAGEVSVPMWLDTGLPELNKALSWSYKGGMPSNRIVEVFGDESCGKTAIATMCMISAQNAGGVAMFNDHERSFDKKLGAKLGLDVTPGIFTLQKPESFEESVTNTIKWIKNIRENNLIDDDAPIVAVFDSLASMVPQSKLAKDVDQQGMNDSLALAKACSAVFPTLSLYAEKYNCLMIMLNQVREKPGVMFGDPTTTPGGRAPKFYSSIRMHIGRKMIKDPKTNKPMGQQVKCKVIKNKVSRPFEEAKWYFMFMPDGTGKFDVVTSTLEHCKEQGILKTSGAYIEWTDGKKYHLKPLAEKIYKEGLVDELNSLLED